jgi:hypothetical protein
MDLNWECIGQSDIRPQRLATPAAETRQGPPKSSSRPFSPLARKTLQPVDLDDRLKLYAHLRRPKKKKRTRRTILQSYAHGEYRHIPMDLDRRDADKCGFCALTVTLVYPRMSW